MSVDLRDIGMNEEAPLETAELVAMARAGDREAFGMLVHRHRGAAYAGVYAVLPRSSPDVDDLLQETFVVALCKLEQLKNPASFAAWIRSIAYRKALNFYQRKREYSLGAEGVGIKYCVMDDPAAHILAEEDQRACISAIAQLDEIYRRVIELFYQQKLSLEEMGAVLRREEGRLVPQGTIKRRLHVARHRLRCILADHDNTVAADT